jgi:hypothetical protein
MLSGGNLKLGRSKLRQEDGNSLNIERITFEDVDWINLAHGYNHVNTVPYFTTTCKGGRFSTT